MKWFKKKKREEKDMPSPQEDVVADGVDEAAELEDEDISLGETVEPEQEDTPEEVAEVGKNGGGLFHRLKSGLAKTREFLITDMDNLFTGGRKFDDDFLEELEERLITADMGVETTMTLVDRISQKASKIGDARGLRAALKEEILSLLPEPAQAGDSGEQAASEKPRVIMVVGVNGVGKTTTIGKLAARAGDRGEKVLIAAADTFRAAAPEQLSIWADRAGADIVRHKENADPAAVAYDSITAAVSRESDLVLVDTAGRLHTKVNLMEELKKIKRSIAKVRADAPHEVLLVLDATTGQNALSQAKLFNDAIGITGIALTKLDGTAKGGIVVGICQSLNVPLKYIGVGEQIDDLQDFDSAKFIDALF